MTQTALMATLSTTLAVGAIRALAATSGEQPMPPQAHDDPDTESADGAFVLSIVY